jgi:hypothetical protein
VSVARAKITQTISEAFAEGGRKYFVNALGRQLSFAKLLSSATNPINLSP